VATFLPSFVFIFLGAPYVERITRAPRISAALAAITAAVVGIIATLALLLARVVLVPDGWQGGISWAALAIAALVCGRSSARSSSCTGLVGAALAGLAVQGFGWA